MARMKSKTCTERGKYKELITTVLFQSSEIKNLLLGDTSQYSPAALRDKFKEYVKSHLFIDDTIEETATFIYYDVLVPYAHENIKDLTIVMYLITHRDIIDTYTPPKGYYGNRVDCLSEMVEDVLLNDENISRSFGIGKLKLDSIEPYNSTRFYGCTMTFSVPNFSYVRVPSANET